MLVTQSLFSWPHSKTLFCLSPTIHTHLLVILFSSVVFSQEVHVMLDCHLSGHRLRFVHLLNYYEVIFAGYDAGCPSLRWEQNSVL